MGPRPAIPLGTPTRPARGMSGFWIRQVSTRTLSPWGADGGPARKRRWSWLHQRVTRAKAVDACRDSAASAAAAADGDLQIDTERHPPQLANTVVERLTADSTDKQGSARKKKYGAHCGQKEVIIAARSIRSNCPCAATTQSPREGSAVLMVMNMCSYNTTPS